MPSMTDPGRTDQTTTSDEQIILGVDTHKDVHVAAVITVLGVQLATAVFATTRVGYRRLLTWARVWVCCAGQGWKGPAPTAPR